MEKTKNIPKIRFKGYKDEWEKIEIGAIANVYDGTHQTPNYTNRGIMFLSVENIKTLKSNKYISEDDFNKNYTAYPEKGDVLMTRIGDVGTSNVIVSNEQLAYYVSLALIKPFDISSYFLNYSIGSNFVKNEISIRTLATAVPKKINMGEISNILIPLPNKEEQKQIGSLLKHLDEKLEIEREKHEKLVNFKKAMLENVFPKEGEKRPKIRFGGYNDDWEEKKLKNIANYSNGVSYEDSVCNNGKYELINLNSISIGGGLKPSHKYVNHATKSLSKNDLVMVLSDVAHGYLLGRVALIPEDDCFVLNQRVASLTIYDDTNADYLMYYINNNQLYFKEKGAGSSQLNISKSVVEDFTVKLPSINEQKLIGSFFKNLDEKIQVSEEKITKIENFKKAMMDGLFV